MSSSFWDELFDREDYRYGTEPNAFLVHRIATLPPRGRVLVLGDGEGRNGVWLARKKFDVVSYDASEVAIRKAKALADKYGVQVDARYGVLPDVELEEGTFDAVVLLYLHAEPELRRGIHALASKALRSGGVLLLEGFSRDQLNYASGGPSDLEMLFSNEQITDELGDLYIEAISTIETKLDEGPGHQGLASVVRVIASKD